MTHTDVDTAKPSFQQQPNQPKPRARTTSSMTATRRNRRQQHRPRFFDAAPWQGPSSRRVHYERIGLATPAIAATLGPLAARARCKPSASPAMPPGSIARRLEKQPEKSSTQSSRTRRSLPADRLHRSVATANGPSSCNYDAKTAGIKVSPGSLSTASRKNADAIIILPPKDALNAVRVVQPFELTQRADSGWA
jgi:hypothetical protein